MIGRIVFEGLDPAILARRLHDSTTNMLRLVGDAVGEDVAESIEHRIRVSKSAPDGARWRAWSGSYAETRGPGTSLGIDTGQMAGAIDHHYDGRDTITVGVSADHAPYFNAAREFMGLSTMDIVRVEHIIESALERGITR